MADHGQPKIEASMGWLCQTPSRHRIRQEYMLKDIFSTHSSTVLPEVFWLAVKMVGYIWEGEFRGPKDLSWVFSHSK